jgi:DNA-directed RNA polymerase specialized sigma24 family protein
MHGMALSASGPLRSAIISTGDAVTFDDLYLTQYAPMVRLAFALVDTRPRAEALVDDAFAAVYERYERIADPVAYVRVCVLNNGRRALRRRRWLRSTGTGAEFNLVIDSIRRLPHRQRAMVLLRYDLRLTDKEIASTLGVSISTVKSTLSRALATLRKEIQ